MEKYELTDDTIDIHNQTLYRIRALKNFADIKAGDIGGYIEKEYNLSHEGDSWIYDNAKVYGDARVSGNARVYDDARVYDNAWVYGGACVYDNALVYGDAKVHGDARVYANAHVYDNARVCNDARIYDNAWVYGNALVSGNVFLNSNAWVSNEAQIYQDADYTIIQGFGTKGRTTTFYRCSDGKIRVNCGCFSGTLDEFREQVKKTREGKIAEEYLEIADLMEHHFE